MGRRAAGEQYQVGVNTKCATSDKILTRRQGGNQRRVNAAGIVGLCLNAAAEQSQADDDQAERVGERPSPVCAQLITRPSSGHAPSSSATSHRRHFLHFFLSHTSFTHTSTVESGGHVSSPGNVGQQSGGQLELIGCEAWTFSAQLMRPASFVRHCCLCSIDQLCVSLAT